ncbi:MAG: lamin tail domain-containing protein [Anaerolineaceae bacterium]|nr:lamin tail domain-containing protein [Anaerolineaceae bacterium]
MIAWKQVFPYLILNIVVAALTTLAILWWWEDSQQRAPSSQSPQSSAVILSAATPTSGSQVSEPPAIIFTPTVMPVDQKVIEIEYVFGVGDINNEAVRIKRIGGGELSLAGWQLRSQKDLSYPFPNLIFITGAIEIYTRIGLDTVIELHWGREQAVWRSGDVVQLIDPHGNVRASYQIP